MNFIGIDTGRNSTKVVSNTTTTFPSIVGTARNLRLENAADYRVTIGGDSYFVGHLANESYDRREMASESKIHQETRILFLTAVALAGYTNPVITTGLPVAQHTPETKALLNALVRGKHTIKVNNNPAKVFSVESIQVVPEGAGAWWDAVLDNQGYIANHSLLHQPVTRILDLGSRTVNYLTLLSGKYLDRGSGTLNYGCMELENIDPELLARRILADLTRRWPDMTPNDTLFLTGGGALVMKDAFAQSQCADNPVTANARGYRKLGMVYAKKNKSGVFR